jgi:signal transduction histidine kinase
MHYSTLQQDTPLVKDNPLYKKTLDLINNASDELRKIAHNMMPEVLMKVGLAEALQDFCNNISSGKLLKINLQTFGMEKRLSSATEIMLYRIIQELVNNIIKHAYATEAIIQINREGNRLSLTIEDNGKGFDTKEVEEKRSMGMATIRSRVDYLNGRLTIDSRKDIGTTVMIDLLLNEN